MSNYYFSTLSCIYFQKNTLVHFLFTSKFLQQWFNLKQSCTKLTIGFSLSLSLSLNRPWHHQKIVVISQKTEIEIYPALRCLNMAEPVSSLGLSVCWTNRILVLSVAASIAINFGLPVWNYQISQGPREPSHLGNGNLWSLNVLTAVFRVLQNVKWLKFHFFLQFLKVLAFLTFQEKSQKRNS